VVDDRGELGVVVAAGARAGEEDTLAAGKSRVRAVVGPAIELGHGEAGAQLLSNT
jgi:hypothetical protein